jgi:hypothetical protein
VLVFPRTGVAAALAVVCTSAAFVTFFALIREVGTGHSWCLASR